jgi:hypothetical protein
VGAIRPNWRDRRGRVSTNGDAEKLYTRYVWLTVGHRVAAVLLGRLRMDVDECIAAYGDLMRAMHGAAPNQLSSASIAAVVADIVLRSGRPSTEAFHSAADDICKVFVGVSPPS